MACDDAEHYYSDKLTLSFDVFCRKKPKFECFNHSCYPDFAGMMRPGHDQSTPFGSSAASQPEGRKSIAHRFQRWVKHYKTTSPVRDEREDVSNNRANRSILSSLTGLWPKGTAVPGDKSPGYYRSSLRDGKISRMERRSPTWRVSGTINFAPAFSEMPASPHSVASGPTSDVFG